MSPVIKVAQYTVLITVVKQHFMNYLSVRLAGPTLQYYYSPN